MHSSFDFDGLRKFQRQLDSSLDPLGLQAIRAWEEQEDLVSKIHKSVSPQLGLGYQEINEHLNSSKRASDLINARTLPLELSALFPGTVALASSSIGHQQSLQDLVLEKFRASDLLGSLSNIIGNIESITDVVKYSASFNTLIGDDGELYVDGEVVSAEDYVEAAAFVTEQESTEEILESVSQRNESLSPRIKRIVIMLILPLLLSILGSIIAKPLVDYVYEGSKTEPRIMVKEAVREVLAEFPDQDTKRLRFVYATSLHVRTKGNRSSEIIDALGPGVLVRVVERKKSWTHINYQDQSTGEEKAGWVFSRYLKRIKRPD